MRKLALLMVLACGASESHSDDVTCVTGSVDYKAADPLSFGRYGGGYGRESSELWDALACASARWRAATCLDVDLSLDPEGWARWLAHELMPAVGSGTATGYVSGPFNDTRIRINASAHPDKICPTMVHEMGHVLRRDYGHSYEDGSMSFPVTHVFSEPVSGITQADIDAVCDYWVCGCSNPE